MIGITMFCTSASFSLAWLAVVGFFLGISTASSVAGAGAFVGSVAVAVLGALLVVLDELDAGMADKVLLMGSLSMIGITMFCTPGLSSLILLNKMS